MKAQSTYSRSGIMLFLLSLVYLGAELVFNRQLLDVTSSVRSDPDQVEHLQYFGRMASGLGFTLLVLGIFQRFGFRISNWKQWAVFFMTCLVCLLPFIMTFGQTLLQTFTGSAPEDDTPYTAGMAWGFLPFVGLYIILVSRGRRPFAVVLGLMILAWPAMFYGQKLAVERFIISPTTAEERLNAHYVLLLRAGIEDCVIQLEDTRFCNGAGGAEVEKRSTRAILGPLFMLNSKAVFESMSLAGDQLIEAIAAQNLWFSSGDYYRRYLRQAAEKHAQYEQYLNDHYYLPYKRASDLYLQAAKPADFEKIAGDASLQVENGIEQGWQKYRQAVMDYHNLGLNVAVHAAQIAAQTQNSYAGLCEGREDDCDRIARKAYNDINKTETRKQLYAVAAEKFYAQTGYPPDIKDKEDFLKNPKTQKELRANIEKTIQKSVEGYALPADWKYNPVTFKTDFLQLMQNQAKDNWRDKVQGQFKTDIAPGLGREAFFKYLKLDPLPPVEDMVMPEKDFQQKYIVPMNRKIAAGALKKIRLEAPGYANGQYLAEQGKDYIRVLYVPAIALCLSLSIVVVTIGRYLANMAGEIATKAPVFKHLTQRQQKLARPLCWGVFLVMVLFLPYLWPNPYTSSAAYQKYYRLARENAAGTARFIDWVVHAQPLIFRAGSL